MKNTIKGLILVLIILTVSFMMPSFVDNADYTKAADGDIYTIVEIVPYKGMGEIGYQIGKQEPVNKELLSMNTAVSYLSFLKEGTISVYPSYVEKPQSDYNQTEEGWFESETYLPQNGYFENIGRGGFDKRNWEERYDRVPDGTGRYDIFLDSDELSNNYELYDQTWVKNVKAYFVYGVSTGIQLYKNYVEYDIYSVTENLTKTGDYDYDYDTHNFLLNKSNGDYDVIFERDNNGHYYMTNDYEIVEDHSGDYYCQVYYKSNRQNKGNYNLKTFSFIFDDENGGVYNWVQDDEALNKPYNYYEDSSGKIWVQGYQIWYLYQYTFNVELINNEFFKRDTLSIPSTQLRDYPVEVITITPEELNLPENYHYLEEADYFYINADYKQDANYIMLYEKYSDAGLILPNEDKYADGQNSKRDNLNFALHDLSWDNVEKIFMRAAGIGGNKAELEFKQTDEFYQDAISDIDSAVNNPYDFLKKQVAKSDLYDIKTATQCNLAKLKLMCNQGKPDDFYNAFMNSVTLDYFITKQYVALNLTGSTGSFFNLDSRDPSPIADAAIYWNEDTFVSPETADDETEDGTEGSNLGTLKRVLNIQPTADFTASETMIHDILGEDANVSIVNMTSTQFNGCMEDINTRYDMIYMGGINGAGRFNFDYYGDTNFNYNTLDEYYYFSVGDRMNSSKTLIRYRGNDITLQKKNDLLNYIAAGYPIVLELNLFQLNGIDRSVSTNIYSFVSNERYGNQNVLSTGNFLSSNYYTRRTFTNSLNSALNIERPILQLLEPTLGINSPVKYVSVNPETEILTIKFALLPNGDNNYNAFVYLDKNGDGIFDTSEKMQPLSGGSAWVDITEGTTYSNQYNMSDLNGVNQWKLVVSRSDNALIKSEVTGFVANTHKKSLYILHIKESSSTYGLGEKVYDSASLILKYAGDDKLTDYDLKFTTMTVQEFEAQYVPTGQAYVKSLPATNKLAAYHLLILDNPNTAISNAKGAVSNIKDEFVNNLGIIFTKNALGYLNQVNYFVPPNIPSWTIIHITDLIAMHLNITVVTIPCTITEILMLAVVLEVITHM